MPDYGAMFAEQAIRETSRKIREIYAQASRELKEKLDSFTKRHLKKQKEMLAKLDAGEITKAAYDAWMKGQVFIGKQWENKLDQAVKIMNNANKVAADIVQKGRFEVFAENYNFASFQAEKHFNVNLGFNLFSTETVSRLVKEVPKILPEWKIDKAKDYIWNHSKILNSITQGIIQGEGIDKIAKRLINDLVTQNWNRMKTFVRTAITGAQNAGRQKQMEDAEKEGITGKKHWLATLDNRTRDTHQELDGQEVPIKEPFRVKVKGKWEEIMCPGDPNALPCLVYNCRCTMFEVYDGIQRKSVRRAYEEDEKGNRKSYIVENMTYKEWKAWKEARDGKKQ